MTESERRDEAEQPQPPGRPKKAFIQATEPLSDEQIDGFFEALGIDPETVPKDDEDAERRERLGLPINRLLEVDLENEQG
jgi:hypothetical protein